MPNHDLWLISDEVYDTQIWEGYLTRWTAWRSGRWSWAPCRKKLCHGSRIGCHRPRHRTSDQSCISPVPGFIVIQEAALSRGLRSRADIAEPFRRRQLAHRVLASRRRGRSSNGSAMYTRCWISPRPASAGVSTRFAWITPPYRGHAGRKFRRVGGGLHSRRHDD
jgi:arginine:pyruvate transaminase